MDMFKYLSFLINKILCGVFRKLFLEDGVENL